MSIKFRSSQSFFNAPPINADPPVNYAMTKPQKLIPISDISSDAVESNFMQTNTRSIIRLLFLSGPSHIARFIVSIVIDPIKAMFGARGLPYIFQKYQKTIFPFFAHCDTPPPIAMKKFIFGVKASLFSALPSFVFFGARKTMIHVSNYFKDARYVKFEIHG